MDEAASVPSGLIYEVGAGYIRSKALYVAAKLGVADQIAEDGSSIAALSEATNTDENALYRIMRLLAGLGIFHEAEHRTFIHTPASERLRTDHDRSQRRMMILWGEEQYDAFADILHSVRTSEPAFEHRHGQSMFDYMKNHDDVHKTFQSFMRSLTGFETAAIIDAYEFSRFGMIVDVGGGNGALLSGILRQATGASGILFDRPNAIELAKSGAGGPLPRCELVEGDFFEHVPEGGDAYILKSVLHDWDDDAAGAILRNCRKAMAEGARLLIMENLVGLANQHSIANQRDIIMMVMTGGMERREQEYRQLLEQADLKLDRVVTTNADVSILEAVAL